MNKKINILFLGGAKRVSVAQHFKEYGKKNGIDISIYSYELNKEVPIASEGEVIVGLKWKDENIYDDLKAHINGKKINIVLPFVDHAIVISSKLKTLCPKVFIPVSDEYLCNIMFDKIEASKWFDKHRIPQPKCYCKELNEFPVILKPRKGSASKDIIVCMDEKECPSNINYEDFLIQEYIEDRTEYSVDCYVAQDGEILSIVPRIRLEVAGGEAVKSIVVRHSEVIKLSEDILNKGDFLGPITIQFIQNNTSKYIYVMEINPRLGGAVVASIGADSGIISFIIKEALNKKVKPITNWKDKTIMTRYFKEVIFYADNN